MQVINIKLERVIFVLLIIVMINIFVGLSSEYKKNEVPINSNMTVEELIQRELGNNSNQHLQYEYIIKENHIFVVVSNEFSNYGAFTKACRINSKSGYVFRIPGIFHSSIYNTKMKKIETPKNSATMYLSKYKTEYVIEIWGLKEDNISYYINGKEMDRLTMDKIVNCESVAVITDLNDIEIYGIQDGQKFSITQDVIELF